MVATQTKYDLLMIKNYNETNHKEKQKVKKKILKNQTKQKKIFKKTHTNNMEPIKQPART